MKIERCHCVTDGPQGPVLLQLKLGISHCCKVPANRPQYIPDAAQPSWGWKGFNKNCLESTLPKNYHWDSVLFDMVIQPLAKFISTSNTIIHITFHLLSMEYVTSNRRGSRFQYEAHFIPLIDSGEAAVGLHSWKHRMDEDIILIYGFSSVYKILQRSQAEVKTDLKQKGPGCF